MEPIDKLTGSEPESDHEARAAELFARRRLGTWTPADEAAFESRLAQDPAFADAARRVAQSWHAMGKHATSPELMALREQALARTRRANARRWGGRGRARRAGAVAAAITGVGLVLGVAFQLSPFGLHPGAYQTGFGEQRTVELSDHSRITLDARTRLRVKVSSDARVVELMDGRAEFSVAKDPGRPFKVEAGGRTVVAVGTLFTVEYVDREMQVAMLEGKVAVLPSQTSIATSHAPPREASRSDDVIELTAGEGMQIRQDGRATVDRKADLEAATAWRQGKVIFRDEALSDAIRRLNRYSRLQLVIEDSSLAQLKVSGVFEAGDAPGFAEAVQSYLPLVADYSDSRTIRLKTK